MRQVLVELTTVVLCPDGKLHHKDNHVFRLMGSLSSRFRFLNRKLDRNVSTSEIWVWTQGDSNCSAGEIEVKERRLDDAPRGDAPKEIHFELYNITNPARIGRIINAT